MNKNPLSAISCIICILYLTPCTTTASGPNSKETGIPGNFIKCLDISYLPEIEAHGGSYKLNYKEMDFFEIISQAGINTVRIRLWNNNLKNEASLENMILLAKRAKAKGLKFLLDFHYSDTWADPGNQTKPAAWNQMDFETLNKTLRDYSYDVITTCINNGVYPDFVQPGNEISAGFLWNTGKIGGSFNTNTGAFAELLKSAISGIKDADTNNSIKIILHHHSGSDFGSLNWFFGHILTHNVHYDIIGVSYYPFYSEKSVSTLKNALIKISSKYKKPILILETAYPWTTAWADDSNNVFGSGGFLLDEYPATPEGQRNYMRDFLDQMYMAGFFGVAYWGGEWIPAKGHGSMWENLALFDFQGKTLPALNMKW